MKKQTKLPPPLKWPTAILGPKPKYKPGDFVRVLFAPILREIDAERKRRRAFDHGAMKECEAILRASRTLNTQAQVVAMVRTRQAAAKRRVAVWDRLGLVEPAETKTGDSKAARTRRR